MEPQKVESTTHERVGIRFMVNLDDVSEPVKTLLVRQYEDGTLEVDVRIAGSWVPLQLIDAKAKIERVEI